MSGQTGDRLAELHDVKRLIEIFSNCPAEPAHDRHVLPQRRSVLAGLPDAEALDLRRRAGREGKMRRISAWLGFGLCAAGLLAAIADAAQTERLIFLSTQLRPIEEAQKMRNLILKDFPREVDYITEQPQQFPVRIEAQEVGGTHAIDVVGALHGELQPLVPLDALVPLDDLAGKMTGRGIPDPLLTLGKFGTAHQLYIPWMQAGYIMVANKKALPYLPGGADINALSYDELAAWASTVQQKTGKPMLGFPAGPQGLMHRFFEGFLYPSHRVH
jgi:multiple sugar transport system substrate-binding protein